MESCIGKRMMTLTLSTTMPNSAASVLINMLAFNSNRRSIKHILNEYIYIPLVIVLSTGSFGFLGVA